jgi:hypothetical protein
VTAAAIAMALGGHRSGNGWRAQCPAHGGDGYNLAISEGANGKPLLHCHSHGCSYGDLAAAIEQQHGSRLGGTSTPAQRAQAASERAQRQAAEQAQRRRDRAASDLLAGGDDVLTRLARQAMVMDGREGDELAERYHALLDRRRQAEVGDGA